MPEQRAAARITPEGESPALVLPQGLRRVPRGVDELATEHLIVNMGPQHPSTHGVLHVLLEIDGEEIIAAEASLGYLHRGIEKLAEHRRYNAVGTLLDRADYVSGIHTELAFAQAAEQLLEIEVPERALWLRSLFSEIVRITSHLVAIGTFGMDVGAMAPFLYIMREREDLLAVLESVTGARMMFNYVRPGGVLNDLTPMAEPTLRKFLKTFRGYLDEYHTLLTGNEIFQARVKGVGVIDRATAIAFGMSGPPLRATGMAYDIRRERPYAAYDKLEFEIPTGANGDCWDRFMVRMDEMAVAADLIEQCLDGLPEGDVMAKVPKVMKPAAGEAYAAVESPRGEVGIHVVADGTDTPYRMHLRAPSLMNLAVIDEVMPGHKIADSVAIIGSLDIVLGEIDR